MATIPSHSQAGAVPAAHGPGTHALARDGGVPVRTTPMPARRAVGERERAMVLATLDHYAAVGQDLPYHGHFETAFRDAYADFMGGGHAWVVATGTGSVYVALAALDLPPGSEVVISPVTDAGPLNCILALGLVPVVADAAPGSYNLGVEQLAQAISPRTSGLLAVHCAGEPLEIGPIVALARRHGIRVLEDCSQAPAARWQGEMVGRFGDIAATSTMYRKTLMTGSSGGLVFTRDEAVFRRTVAIADRGKPIWRDDYDLRSPAQHLFPALNWNTGELSCAVGLASLERLQQVVDARVAFVKMLIERLEARDGVCRPYRFHDGFSPFFFPIWVDVDRLTVDKPTFAEAVKAEGIDLNPDYGFLIHDWAWAKPHIPSGVRTPNAVATRDGSFNLFLNERYGTREADDIVAAIAKVERHLAR